VAAKWPTEHRVAGVSWEVLKILASAEDPYEAIAHPPLNERTGRRSWDGDAAKRMVGWKTSTPVTWRRRRRPSPIWCGTFVLLPKRWVVERSVSWIMRARRNCRDYEALPQHSEAHLAWTVVTLMTRRLTKPVADWREPKPPPPPPVRSLRIRLHPWTVRLAPAPR
jgi:hypothetical protein